MTPISIFIYTFNNIIFTEFIINKINEENDQNIRPLLNDILDNVDHKMSTNYQEIIQYIILSNYMGDPTSPILIQEISG